MTKTFTELADEYAAGLQDYLAGGGEAALQRGYELGRHALFEGMGVLEMGALHHEAVRIVLRSPAAGPEATVLEAAEAFFAESLAAFEMTHRGFQEANAALRRMNERLEEEAKRIAHLLHDEAGQLLASVHLALDDLARDLPPAKERFQAIRGMLMQIEQEIRRLSHELRPTVLDDLGLVPALNFLVEGVAKRSGLLISVEGSTDARLSPSIETSLYRIVQEALTNCVRHAKARRVWIRVERDAQTVRCTIQDDGVGFDTSAVMASAGERGFGLIAIRERVDSLRGTLRIISGPGRGTTLSAWFDVEA